MFDPLIKKVSIIFDEITKKTVRPKKCSSIFILMNIFSAVKNQFKLFIEKSLFTLFFEIQNSSKKMFTEKS